MKRLVFGFSGCWVFGALALFAATSFAADAPQLRVNLTSQPSGATVIIDGEPATVHVKNTGRCRELLVPGATVWLSVADDPSRRTKYDLVAVEKKRAGNTPLLINMDSQAPNAAVAEWLPVSGLFLPDARFCREVTHGNSRFDFAVYEG